MAETAVSESASAASPLQEASRVDESDPRASLRHVLAASPSVAAESPAPPIERTPSKTGTNSQPTEPINNMNGDASTQHLATMTTTTRRNANGSVSSVYSGNKIRYLKKDDGQPLWRADIQFLFLKLVFQDTQRVFTNPSDGTKGHTFAEIYIDTMAKSSKCSGILKDKLLTDHEAAVHMAMICLLVNVGRMNTTLNFFPEMRARVRTYHPIPSLQAHQSQQAYKQLQDGPRLKSILKGATEDIQQPSTVPGIRAATTPRTNPVNLIFVLSQYAPKITEMHFTPPTDFFDLFMKSTLSSRTRANAFLWMIWWYLESDFSHTDAARNPFGKGLPTGPDSTDVPIKVPQLDTLTEEEAAEENIDTEEEIAFGELKTRERLAIVANDIPGSNSVPKKNGKSPTRRGRDDSPQADSQRADSMSPTSSHPLAIAPGTRVVDVVGSLPFSVTRNPRESSRRGVGRGNYPRKPRDASLRSSDVHCSDNLINLLPADRRQSRDLQYREFPESPSGMSNAPYGTGKSGMHRRRPPTAHQQALDQNRRERVDYLLDQNMRNEQKMKQRERRRRGVIVDAWIKSRTLPEGWDSESDENAGKTGGLDEIVPDRSDLTGDVGEKAGELARAWRRVGKALDGLVVERIRRPKPSRVRGPASQKELNAAVQGFGYPTEWSTHGSAGFALPTGTEPLTLDGDGYQPSPQVPRKKRPYSKRRTTVRKPIAPADDATPTSGKAVASDLSSGKKRKRVATVKESGKKSSLGQQGVPLDIYFNNDDDTGNSTPTKRRARVSTGTSKKKAGNSTRATASRRAATKAAAAAAAATVATATNKTDADTEAEADGALEIPLSAAGTPVSMIDDDDGGEAEDTTMLDESTIVESRADEEDQGEEDEAEVEDGEEVADSVLSEMDEAEAEADADADVLYPYEEEEDEEEDDEEEEEGEEEADEMRTPDVRDTESNMTDADVDGDVDVDEEYDDEEDELAADNGGYHPPSSASKPPTSSSSRPAPPTNRTDGNKRDVIMVDAPVSPNAARK